MPPTSAEIEITEIPPLSPGEASLLDMHSVLNVLNVLHGELIVLGLTLAEDGDLLAPALQLCDRFQADLEDPAASLRQAAATETMLEQIEHTIAAELERHPGSADDPAIEDSLANIRSVGRVFRVRAQELLARAGSPDAWVAMPIAGLRDDFLMVFAAIEKHSRGRYRIIYNLAQQQPSDYYVDFKIESEDGSAVSMPPVFKDVMRDLLANARKYTTPGGTINAGLHETASSLRFTVQDTGQGIPREELTTVVHYGRRGSNVAQVRTLGGGFGLTKAFLVTKRFGGRFFISSEVGVGTRIRIEIPRPAPVA
jgi:signal transduction histidine kinase